MRRILIACVMLAAGAASGQSTYYVAPGGSHTSPYDTWAKAATQLVAATDLAGNGDLVLVSNGVYDTGISIVLDGLTNRVTLGTNVTLRSVNGPEVTTIVGGPATIGVGVRSIYVWSDGQIDGFTVSSGATPNANAAYKREGANIWATPTTLITNCIVKDGIARNTAGGILNGIVKNSVISGNRANAGSGGGLYECNAFDSTIISNTAAGYGAGLYLGSASNCLISYNSCGNAGGGAYRATLIDCVLEYNSVPASSWGGGSSECQGGYGSVTRSIYRHNVGGYGGGASYKDTLYSCLLVSNRVTGANAHYQLGRGGGGAALSALNNCTVLYNSNESASTNAHAGGVYQCTGISNSIVWHNTAPFDSNHIDSAFAYSLSGPVPVGDGNIAGDPVLSATFGLAAGSPCIDTGTNADWMATATDLAGNARIYNVIVDMGAYEFQGATPAASGTRLSTVQQIVNLIQRGSVQ